MSFDPDRLRRFVYPAVDQDLAVRDTMLYALSVGYGSDPTDPRQLRYVFENDLLAAPTLAITVSINDSPLAGRAGDKVQSRVIRARLLAEAESNVAIRVTETANKDAYEVAGRGELQLGVLVETMRREGFELSLSRPKVLTRSENGQTLEPVEEVVIDVDDEYTGVVIEKMSIRKGELQDMRPSGGGKTRIVMYAQIPVTRSTTNERKSPAPVRARLRLGHPPDKVMPNPNTIPPEIAPAQPRFVVK